MSEVIRLINQKLQQGRWHSFITIELMSISLMWLFTVSALIGIGFGHVDWFIPKTPINLLLCFLLLLINVPFGESKGVAAFSIAFVVGMAVEIAGVATGSIFGVYEYGSNLGFKAWGVPLMIGIYWAVLVTVTSQMSRNWFKNILVAAAVGSALMVGLDFVMEQLASYFDFWHFEGGVARLQNYIAWFIIAFFLQIFAIKWMPKVEGEFSHHLFLNQFVFFGASYYFLIIR